MKSSPWIVFWGLFILALPLAGQAAPDWYLDKPISDIRFDGLVTVQKSDIEGVTKPYLGKPFTESLFQDLQTAIYNLDFFEGLIVPTAIRANSEGTAVILLFKVTEKPIVDVIEFSGADKLRPSELQGELTLKKGDLINLAKVKNDEQALLNYYREKGFLDADVQSTTQEIDSRKTKVIYKITEGIQTSVKSIEFQGNTFVSSNTLRGLLQTKVQGLFDNGLFKEATFSKDLRTIESYYWNHGYLDAKVIDVQRNVVQDASSGRNGLAIVISLKEGDPLTFGGFEFSGNQIFTTATLEGLVRQVKGKVISKDLLEADYQRVVDLYLENGYIFNNITRKENREGSVVSYVVTIVERPRAHIENIVVKGNTKTHDDVILREMPIEVGDVFNKSRIVEGIRNLYNLQYFSTISPETPQGSADGLMDLVLNVEEGKTADVSFGLTFSGTEDFPLAATVKWSEKNFMGTGQTLGVDSTLSPTNQSINLTYSENWFMDRRMSLGASVGFAHKTVTAAQDILGPTYSGDTEMPDPYKDNEYVFTKTTAYNGKTYHAGDLFPGEPTDDNIDTYDLVTRYEYDVSNSTVKDNTTMEYQLWQLSAGANTGYAWYTRWGRFAVSTGLKSTLSMVTYDDTIYRPADQSLRDNLDQWLLSNQWWNKASWDTRDIVYNPTNGALLSETVTFVGGFLGGTSHYTKLDSKIDSFLKFVSIPVTDKYSFDLVLRAKSTSAILFPTLGFNQYSIQSDDKLYIDGMTAGRGWGTQTGGRATWASSLEIRTPVPFLSDLLWYDTFLDDSVLVSYTSAFQNPFMRPLSAHKLSWGTGFRLVSQQFPLALYLAKPFKFRSDNSIKWAAGDGIFGSDIDMALVVSFGLEY